MFADTELCTHLSKLDLERLQHRYWSQGEFLHLEGVLPSSIVQSWTSALDRLLPHVRRSFIPRHKAGGSVSAAHLRTLAPDIDVVYRSAAVLRFVSSIVRADVCPCPKRDLHAYALYAYTEPGDHIGYHYDTSYYRGRRYTLLWGLLDESTARLSCRLHTRDASREVVKLDLRLGPGTLVLFNGDTVQHCVTPLGQGERRFVITMQYVTDPTMSLWNRFVSDTKDAVAYFGFRQVFARRRR